MPDVVNMSCWFCKYFLITQFLFQSKVFVCFFSSLHCNALEIYLSYICNSSDQNRFIGFVPHIILLLIYANSRKHCFQSDIAQHNCGCDLSNVIFVSFAVTRKCRYKDFIYEKAGFVLTNRQIVTICNVSNPFIKCRIKSVSLKRQWKWIMRFPVIGPLDRFYES